MPGKPFQSKLEPHFDFILEARRKRQTWEAIAQQLASLGITTTKQAVHIFLKRRLKRRYPLGMAPPFEMKQPAANILPAAGVPKLTENLPVTSDFDSDPLTLPPMGRKPMWGLLKPNP